MSFSEVNRQLRGVENATAEEMLRLLGLAKVEVERRLSELPLDSSAALVYRQVEASLADAMARLNFAMGGVMQEGAREAARLGVGLAEASLAAGGVPAAAAVPFSLPPPLLQQLAIYEASLVTGLTDTLRHDITQVIQLGILGGTPKEEMIRNVVGAGLEPVSPFQSAEARAEVIARTEINRIANVASYERGQAAAAHVPGLTKTWRTARDARVRPSHVALDGKTVPYEEKFSVGGHPAKHPHDGSLPAAEGVQCRCRLTYRSAATGAEARTGSP